MRLHLSHEQEPISLMWSEASWPGVAVDGAVNLDIIHFTIRGVHNDLAIITLSRAQHWDTNEWYIEESIVKNGF